MKIIWSGLESSGKSLKLAMMADTIAYRNHDWFLQSGIVRPIYSNLRFSEAFYREVTEDLGIPIHYWSNLDELIKVRDADVFIDEVGTYFDSRLWSELSLDVRRWLSQAAKMGIEVYGTAQDFAQVDLAFRRLVNHLFLITKIIGSRRPSATKPPVKKVWGVCAVRELDPQGYKEDEKKFDRTQLIPDFFFIERQFCEIFDTTQQIQRSLPPMYKHIERMCEDQACRYHKTIHI